MNNEGMSTEYLNNMNWDEFDMANTTQEQFEEFEHPISRFFKNYTMEELYQGSIERGIMLYPIYSAKEISENPQLKARGFWEEVRHPELGETLVYPGSFVQFSGERPPIYLRAPLIGEHNEEVYHELGFSHDDLVILKQAGVI
jgi:crotonobetainyl-CoA:carnitine CoA-transferase CaiB-like acyl-CoA transferase